MPSLLRQLLRCGSMGLFVIAAITVGASVTAEEGKAVATPPGEGLAASAEEITEQTLAEVEQIGGACLGTIPSPMLNRPSRS